MPNWCQNTIVVSGEAAEISAFNDWLDDGKALLSKIKPTPQTLVETVAGFIGDPDEQKKLEERCAANVKEFGYKNWYDWNIGNWGTKWDVDAEIDEASSISEQVILSFESAWSPPQKAIALMAEKFPKLTIRHSYLEEGMCFVGYDLYTDGGVAEEVYNGDSQSEEWKQLAADEFGWEPWPDEDEMEENEEGKATETPKTVVGEVLDIISNFSKETRDRVKKTKKKVKKPSSKKKTTKKIAKKKKKK